MVPPAYVKPFVKRQKNDANDAEAIVEVAQRPNMTFVTHKTEEQQGRAMVFRVREILVIQRTQLINSLRGLLAEFGVIAPTGRANVEKLCDEVHDPESRLPDNAVEVGQIMLEQINLCQDKIDYLEKKTLQVVKTNEEPRRVMPYWGSDPLQLWPFKPSPRIWRALKTVDTLRHGLGSSRNRNRLAGNLF